jgi:glycosyltransferase involved in cell wall biosynthesis
VDNQKIAYWAPCLGNVGTVKSVLNSAIAFKKFSNKDVYIIDACGEWETLDYKIKINGLKKFSLSKFKYFKYLPKTGFLQSRFSYILIFLLSFFPLLNFLKKEKPEFLVIHLITSLPLFLYFLFNFSTKLVLRISGNPKMNIFRKYYWKILEKKIYQVTSPTKELIKNLLSNNIFKNVKYLPDAIFYLDNEYKLQCKKLSEEDLLNFKYIISVGRLTQQKNHKYLINEFYKISSIFKDLNLVILGSGEEKKNLLTLIETLNLKNRVFLIGYKNNVNYFLKNAEVFVSSSVWEEFGFAMIESAFNNTFIISSDCPNGPKEFLNEGKSGYLYESQKEGALSEKIILFMNNKNFLRKQIFQAKKNCLQFGILRHYLEFKKILN